MHSTEKIDGQISELPDGYMCLHTPTSLDCSQLRPGSREKLYSKIHIESRSVFVDFAIGDVMLWENIWEGSLIAWEKKANLILLFKLWKIF